MTESGKDVRNGRGFPREVRLQERLDLRLTGDLSSLNRAFSGFTDFRPIQIRSRTVSESDAELERNKTRDRKQ